ncbi:LLM class flavin-dependent oxidoreductase [Paraburkholderia phymatum]|uniref:LLM class flavin-dependent oxidoreductase n=1 Tax=Paraburkholderia phymatum TaxID=148447 RepID=A0ACC6TY43_9BURK
MTSLSVLDLVMIGEGKELADSLQDALRLARHVEWNGYQRYWVAEHHNMPGIGSAATSLVISHLAAGTATLRIGSGGIMLPNHSPLVVAEQFGTLDSLYPGRIDLGVGRAPGADSATSHAVRGANTAARDLAEDVALLQGYLSDDGSQSIRAIPGRRDVPIWILGSGIYGAHLAAAMGLPFAFASHFAPQLLWQAVAAYRQNFKPSEHLARPYLTLGVNAFAAETREEAAFLASSHFQWVANLHSGNPGPLPKPVDGFVESLSESARYRLMQELSCIAIGTKIEVGNWLRKFIEETGADELMIDARIFDVAARCRSYELVAASLAQ